MAEQTDEQRKRPDFDLKKCTGCVACFVGCSENAITLGKKCLPVLNTKKCTGCGKCVERCEEKAITMKPVLETW